MRADEMDNDWWRYDVEAVASDARVVRGKLTWAAQIQGADADSSDDYLREFADVCEYMKGAFEPPPSQAPHVSVSGGKQWMRPLGGEPQFEIDAESSTQSGRKPQPFGRKLGYKIVTYDQTKPMGTVSKNLGGGDALDRPRPSHPCRT
jgi:hypothetical protein